MRGKEEGVVFEGDIPRFVILFLAVNSKNHVSERQSSFCNGGSIFFSIIHKDQIRDEARSGLGSRSPCSGHSMTPLSLYDPLYPRRINRNKTFSQVHATL